MGFVVSLYLYTRHNNPIHRFADEVDGVVDVELNFSCYKYKINF